MKLWLTSFAYTDSNEVLHIDVPALLKALGVEDTIENRDRCTEIARQHLESLLKDTKAVIKVTE